MLVFSAFFLKCRITFPRYKQFGTKSALFFGFAKSSKYKPIFPLSQIPKLLVACVMGRLFCRNYNYHTKFSRFCWQNPILRFCFSARNFRFIIFNYSLLIFALNFSSFCWQIPTFTLLLFRFQFSSFCWQVPIFTLQFFVFLLSDSNFPTSAGDSNFHASALWIFCELQTSFSNRNYLRNFGTTAP